MFTTCSRKQQDVHHSTEQFKCTYVQLQFTFTTVNMFLRIRWIYLLEDRQLFICGYQSSLIQKVHHLTWRGESWHATWESDGETHHILAHGNKMGLEPSSVIVTPVSTCENARGALLLRLQIRVQPHIQALTLSLVVMSMSRGVSPSTAEVSMVRRYPPRTTCTWQTSAYNDSAATIWVIVNYKIVWQMRLLIVRH